MGVKFLTLIAGFAGGIVSLSFIQNLSKSQGAVAVLAGLGSAIFFAPLPTPWTASMLHGLTAVPEIPLDWEIKVEAAYGFLFGITGMTLVPGFIAIAARFREDPLWLPRLLLNRGRDRDKP